MDDSIVLRETDPCGSYIVGDGASSSNSGPMESKLMPLGAEMTPGLVEPELISKNSSLRKRKDSHSGTGSFGNSTGSPEKQDKIVRASHADRQHTQFAPQRNEDEETACRQPGPLDGVLLEAKKRKLVLHIDLNNTILVSDAVANQDPRAALNNYLSTVTWGKVSPTGKWQWLSESPSLLPPCPDAVNFYSQFGSSKLFTETPLGQRFRDLHAHHLRLLEWQGQPHPTLSIPGDRQAGPYHLVLPSFFHLLQSLHREGRHFAVIFRTFGIDLPRVLRAVRCALEGKHPHFPALQDLSLPVDLHPGKIQCSKQKVTIIPGGERAERISAVLSDREIYTYLSAKEGLCGFRDHFQWWARNQYSSQGGKPLWIDPHDASIHHIFIDDNIRLSDSDTIIHPRVFCRQGDASAQVRPTSELYDICLVQTDLLKAIADTNYFCRCIRRCEENYAKYLACAEGCT